MSKKEDHDKKRAAVKSRAVKKKTSSHNLTSDKSSRSGESITEKQHLSQSTASPKKSSTKQKGNHLSRSHKPAKSDSIKTDLTSKYGSNISSNKEQTDKHLLNTTHGSSKPNDRKLSSNDQHPARDRSMSVSDRHRTQGSAKSPKKERSRDKTDKPNPSHAADKPTPTRDRSKSVSDVKYKQGPDNDLDKLIEKKTKRPNKEHLNENVKRTPNNERRSSKPKIESNTTIPKTNGKSKNTKLDSRKEKVTNSDQAEKQLRSTSDKDTSPAIEDSEKSHDKGKTKKKNEDLSENTTINKKERDPHKDIDSEELTEKSAKEKLKSSGKSQSPNDEVLDEKDKVEKSPDSKPNSPKLNQSQNQEKKKPKSKKKKVKRAGSPRINSKRTDSAEHLISGGRARSATVAVDDRDKSDRQLDFVNPKLSNKSSSSGALEIKSLRKVPVDEFGEDEDEVDNVISKLLASITPGTKKSLLKSFENAFRGSEVVDFLMHGSNIDVRTRSEATKIGSMLHNRKVFVVVKGKDKEFKDNSVLYRFNWISCQSYRESGTPSKVVLNLVKHWNPNAKKDETPLEIVQKLFKKLVEMIAKYSDEKMDKESDLTDYPFIHTGKLDFKALCNSDDYRRFTLATCQLQKVVLLELVNKTSKKGKSSKDAEIFFINVHNILVIHSHLLLQSEPKNLLDKKVVMDYCFYQIGEHEFSPAIIRDYILSSNKQFPSSDSRIRYVVPVTDTNRVAWSLSDATLSSPPPILYLPENFKELAQENLKRFINNQIQILEKDGQVFLPAFLKVFEKELIKSSEDKSEGTKVLAAIRSYLDKRNDSIIGSIEKLGFDWEIKYKTYDWTIQYPCWMVGLYD